MERNSSRRNKSPIQKWDMGIGGTSWWKEGHRMQVSVHNEIQIRWNN